MSAIPLYNDQELLLLIAEGDERAFGRFYHQTNAGIYNAVMAYIKEPQTAREIIQVVYLKVWDHRQNLVAVRSLQNYLFILARNATFDHLKKVTAENRCLAGFREQIPQLHDNVMLHMEERECRHLYNQVISRLPGRQREVYLLASEQEMSYEEIASSMQVSRFTVKRHLELARRFVRKYIHHHLQGQALLPLFIFLASFFQ